MPETKRKSKSAEGMSNEQVRKKVCKGFVWPHYYINKQVVEVTDSRDLKSTKTGINVHGNSHTISTGLEDGAMELERDCGTARVS